MEISEIKDLMEHGNYDRALAAIEDLSAEDVLEGLILQGRILERKGELNKALQAAKIALQECQARGTEYQELRALINLAYVHLEQGNLAELTELRREGEQKIHSIEHDSQDAIKECQASLAYLGGYETFLKGDVQSSINSLEKSLVIRQALKKQHDIVETLTALGFIHIDTTGKTNLAFDYFIRSLSISEKLGNPTAIAHSLNRLGVYYFATNNMDEALSYLERSLALYQELDNLLWIAGLCNNISLVYIAKENYGLALNHLERALASSEKLGGKIGEVITLENIGWLYGLKGDPNTAIIYFQKCLDIREESGQKLYTAFCLQLMGDAHLSWTGDLGLAIEYLNKSLSICNEIGSALHKAWALISLSNAYTRQGELEVALSEAQESLNIFSKIDNKRGIAQCYATLGIIYRNLGKYDLAIKNLDASINLMKEVTVGGSLALRSSYLLTHLVLVAQDLDDFDLAQEYLKQLQEVHQQSQSKYVKLRTRFSEAIVLKMSKRAAKKFQAQQIFAAIIDEEVIDINLTVLAMLNLCELLILEMRYSETAEELLQEVTILSKKFSDKAQKQQSSALMVMSLLLQTKLTLIHGDFEDASSLLSTAKKIASEKKLGNLLSQVKSEQETVQAELDKWDDLILRKASTHERIEQARLVEYISRAKKIQGAWVRPSTELVNQ
ncbi:MAG: tetratricopeptide repeat protein [Candidatus Hodarchaeales archaeon]|jgi:tetratricopeptide (TPR) repeat protein